MAYGLTACGSTTTDLTGDVSEEDTVEEVEIVEEEPVEEEPVIEAPVEETVVDDVVDDEKLVYVNETIATWSNDTGIIYTFEKEDGQFDIITFKADFVRDGTEVDVNKVYEGASFTAALNVGLLKDAPLEKYVGITDDSKDLIIWIAYDESDALTIDTNSIMVTTDKYQEISAGHFVVAYTDDIGEDVAQEVLDSCVYYDNEEEVIRQWKTMDDSVTK